MLQAPASVSTSDSTFTSVVSISSDEDVMQPVPDNSIVIPPVSVDAELFKLLCQRFPQVMFDKNFLKDASFWSAFSPVLSSITGNSAGPSNWISVPVLDSTSVRSDEVLDPTPLAVVPPSDFLALPDPSPEAPVKRSYKKRVAGSPVVTTGLRRSSRLLAISDGHKTNVIDNSLVEPDPNQGVGKPRGISVKKLKQVAHEVGILFSGGMLHDSDFASSLSDITGSAEAAVPSDCPIPLLQKMATDLCGVPPQDVTQEGLLSPSRNDDAES